MNLWILVVLDKPSVVSVSAMSVYRVLLVYKGLFAELSLEGLSVVLLVYQGCSDALLGLARAKKLTANILNFVDDYETIIFYEYYKIIVFVFFACVVFVCPNIFYLDYWGT